MKDRFHNLLKSVSQFQAKFILSLIFLIVLPIFAFISKLIEKNHKAGWSKWTKSSDSIEDIKKEY